MNIQIGIGKRSRQPFKKATLERARYLYSQWRKNAKESKIYLAIMFAIAEGICPMCGRPMILRFDQCDADNLATFDHEERLADNPVHNKLNLIIMCKRCNGIKS